MTSFGVRHGVGLHSKVRIIIYAFLYPMQWTLGSHFRWIKRTILRLAPDFSDVMIEIKGNRYVLIDPESLLVLAFGEKWMWKHLIINKDDVFLDIGAHLGKYSIPLSRIASKVVAVEADPENFKCLKRNIDLNKIKNITAVNIAAWDKSAVVKFYFTIGSGGRTAKEDLPDHRYTNGYIELQAEAMDQILRSHGISRVDWIKIDVEGAEYEVLKGLKETLVMQKPKVIVEVMKSNKKRVLTLMRNLGYNTELISKYESPFIAYYHFKPKITPFHS